MRKGAVVVGLAVAALAAGCASGAKGGGGARSVLDITWGWGWNMTGSATGPYADQSPGEREKRLDYYRAHVRTEDAQGNPVKPVDQAQFVADAKSNAPTGKDAEPASFFDVKGNRVRLEDWRGKKALVLVFTRGYPGYLCPLCTSYTAQIAHRYREIAAAGGEVLLVYPGAPDRVQDFLDAAREIAEQEGEDALPFPVLLDTELRQVAAFGIQGDLAKPSTYVIDLAGKVRFAFVGEQSHERPDVDTILAELRRPGVAK